MQQKTKPKETGFEKSQIIGWREWISLPQLGIPRIKAKIDTGARTSALHAFQIDAYRKNREDWVRFFIHPKQGRTHKVLTCNARYVDIRWVMDSGGHRELRYVIETIIEAGSISWPIEITLTNRDDMRFRMLLGRTALRSRFLIDTSSSYVLGKYTLPK